MEGPPLPTPQQSERMKKYGEDIARRAAEQERKAVQNEFLRHSIRNSQKMRALKGNLHNYAFYFILPLLPGLQTCFDYNPNFNEASGNNLLLKQKDFA